MIAYCVTMSVMQRTDIPLVADLATDLAHCASACCPS
jgi:hypothetical protein